MVHLNRVLRSRFVRSSFARKVATHPDDSRKKKRSVKRLDSRMGAKALKRADDVIERARKSMKLIALSHELNRIYNLAKLGRRDLDDLLLVAQTIRNHRGFVKELKHLHFNWDKHPHSRHVGLN